MSIETKSPEVMIWQLRQYRMWSVCGTKGSKRMKLNQSLKHTEHPEEKREDDWNLLNKWIGNYKSFCQV